MASETLQLAAMTVTFCPEKHRFGMAYLLGHKTVYIITYSSEMSDGVFYASYMMDGLLGGGSFRHSDFIRQPDKDLVERPLLH